MRYIQKSLESETLVPNKTRLKPSVPSFARGLILTITVTSTLSASLLDFKYLQDAKDAYSDKNYTLAQELYSKVKGDEAKFNEADALYRQKKYKEAIEKYQSITDPKLKAKSLHNIGNSYANMKKIDEAISSYEEALKIEDDADTKYNLELLKKKKEEQKKKQQQKKKEDKKNKDDKKKDDKQDKKEQKNKKDGQDKDKNNNEKKKPSKDKDKSQKEKEKEQKEKEKKEAEKKKQEEEKKKAQQAKMGDQNKTQPPISNMEERKWQKSLDQRGVNTLMIPLNKGEKKNDTNPW